MSEIDDITNVEKSKPMPAMLGHYLEPLDRFLLSDDFNDVAINRPFEVFAKGKGTDWIRYDVPELSFDHCEKLATLIASFNGKSIPSNGFLSAEMPRGERINIAVPPACERGTVSLTIRKGSDEVKTLDQLDSEGAFALAQGVKREIKDFEKTLLQLKNELRIREFLELAVLKQRVILIVGVTGSGKTFLMKSLARVIPSNERLVTIEDVHEVKLPHHPNHVHLFFARDGEGSKKPTPKEALAACLRMEPKRILLAELRGDEAWEFIKSIGTGHGGAIATAHAGGAWEAFEQIASLVKDSQTGSHLDIDYIKRRLYGVIDVILYYDKLKLHEIYYDPEFKLKNLG